MAVVTKYCTFSPSETGKGFITPTDASQLRFSIVANIARVIGEEKTADDWIARIKGSPSTKEAYDAEATKPDPVVSRLDAIKAVCDEILVIVKR